MKPTQLAASALFVTLGLSSLAAQAQTSNGGFESGLSGWSVYGDASAQGSAPVGSSKLFLTTAGLDPDELDGAGAVIGPFNVSGVAALDVGLPGGLENLNGNAIGAFDAFGQFAYSGSMARQTFNAQAGDTLSFLWNFGTRETELDHAFVVIDGIVISLSGPSLPTLVGSGDDLFQTGLQSFNSSFTTSGSHTVAFGVVNFQDYAVRSSLTIDQVQITAVPEADAWAMFLLGGAGLLAAKRGARKSVAKTK